MALVTCIMLLTQGKSSWLFYTAGGGTQDGCYFGLLVSVSSERKLTRSKTSQNKEKAHLLIFRKTIELVERLSFRSWLERTQKRGMMNDWGRLPTKSKGGIQYLLRKSIQKASLAIVWPNDIPQSKTVILLLTGKDHLKISEFSNARGTTDQQRIEPVAPMIYGFRLSNQSADLTCALEVQTKLFPTQSITPRSGKPLP